MRLISLALLLGAVGLSKGAGQGEHYSSSYWDHQFDISPTPVSHEHGYDLSQLPYHPQPEFGMHFGSFDWETPFDRQLDLRAPASTNDQVEWQQQDHQQREQHQQQQHNQDLHYMPQEELHAYDSHANSNLDDQFNLLSQLYSTQHSSSSSMQSAAEPNVHHHEEGSQPTQTRRRRPGWRITKGTFGSSSKGRPSKGTVLSPEVMEELAAANRLREQLGELWERKGLWVGMLPKEMAAGIAEIKVSMGESGSVSGPILHQHVRDDPASSKEYMGEVSSWTRKFTTRIRKLHDQCDMVTPVPAVGVERQRTVYKYLRFLKTREEYRKLRSNESEVKHDMRKIEEEAEKVWQVLLEHARHSGIPRIDGDTPMEVIEEQSRYLLLFLHKPYTIEEVANYIRFHLMDAFHKTEAEVDIFNKARNQWLHHVFLERQQRNEEQQEIVTDDSPDSLSQLDWNHEML